jgi:hypothetical protein
MLCYVVLVCPPQFSNLARSCSIEMVQPVPGTVLDSKQNATLCYVVFVSLGTMEDSKQNAICCVLFVLRCSNLAKSCSIEMVQPVPSTSLDARQDATCCVLFVLVCGSRFSKSCSIEMVQPVLGTVLQAKQDTACCAMFVLFVYLNSVARPNYAQLNWFNLLMAMANKLDHVVLCLSIFVDCCFRSFILHADKLKMKMRQYKWVRIEDSPSYATWPPVGGMWHCSQSVKLCKNKCMCCPCCFKYIILHVNRLA